MALINRDKDNSEKREVYTIESTGVIATGVTKYVFVAPYPCVVQSVNYAAQGVSNALILSLNKNYFVAGAGLTAVAMGISGIVAANYSVSGFISYSGLQTQGHTNLNLNAGDMVSLVSAGTNAALSDLTLSVVVRKTQEIVSYNGF